MKLKSNRFAVIPVMCSHCKKYVWMKDMNRIKFFTSKKREYSMAEIRAGPEVVLFLCKKMRKKDRAVNEILMQTYTIALPVLLGYIVWLLKNQKRVRDANSKGTMLLLRVQLIEYHSKYTQLGDIPSYAYQNFCEMYEAYHVLGGNGMITKMKQEIDELHLKKKGD